MPQNVVVPGGAKFYAIHGEWAYSFAEQKNAELFLQMIIEGKLDIFDLKKMVRIHVNDLKPAAQGSERPN